MHFKTVRLTTIHNELKLTISIRSEFELLQMVLKLDTEWCASENVGSPRGVDYEIPHQLEREMKYSS